MLDMIPNFETVDAAELLSLGGPVLIRNLITLFQKKRLLDLELKPMYVAYSALWPTST